ncbi:MBL fold metallo-hydrolase [Pseudogracilibacillus sp. SO10305]|uniref:MBL fold metallo-hydrolase n=1 Tax=Pseudogracilibacillus sp. SO10305 TaxID=3098292 RepID=UPI00300E2E63
MYRKIIMTLLMAILLIACTNDVVTNENESNNENNVPMEQNESGEVAESETNKKEKTSTQSDKKAQKLDDLTVHYMDVGQGDATLFQVKDKDETYHILYDTGDWKGNEVVPYLKDLKVDYIDIIIISHPHADHIGQLHKVLDQFDVGEVWMSSNTAQSEVYNKAVEAIVKSDADFDEPKAGDVFDIGPLQLTILHPANVTGNLNEDSISFHAQYGDISFLFTGDASKTEEKIMLENDLPIEATVLQLGHHGSNTSSDPKFVEEVNPEIAIYSAGIDNKYGHPHEEVIDLFATKDIPLYGTDTYGNIVIKTDGKTYEVDKGKKKKQKQTEKEKKKAACININDASKEELMEIIHIGDVRADALIEHRPYTSVEDLSIIDGIGPGRISDIIEEGKACIEE